MGCGCGDLISETLCRSRQPLKLPECCTTCVPEAALPRLTLQLSIGIRGVWWWSILHMCSQVHVGKYAKLHNHDLTDFGAATAQLLPTQPHHMPLVVA
eukprot:jgi/Chrzof1/7603/Cz02g29250.t1